jgi:uncharacterized phage protein (TIGR02218 family)
MAQDYTYFEGYTTGVQPSDWTSRWVTTGETWAVQEDAANDIRGKHLEHTRTTTARRLLSWDTPASGSDTNTELLVRFRTSATVAADQFSLILRASGGAATETGYLFRNNTGNQVQISLLNAGTLSAIGASVSFGNILANQWYWLRFQARADALKAKIWIGDHDQEPSTWTIERTDSTIAGAGWFGVGNIATTGIRDYDAVAVGTAGDDAVFPVSPAVRMTQAAMLVLDAPEADARMTQLAMLVLGEEGVDTMARITQAALLVLGEPQSEEARLTQATLLALAEFEAGTRITQVAALVLADQVNCLTRWAQCWTITRTDGEVYAFTSLDRPLTFRGIVHEPCNSLAASAVELSTIVGVTGNMELQGILSDGGVSEADLYNGLFDGANIEVWMVPWDNSGGEIPFRLMGGVTGANGHGETSFSQEILTPGAQLQQRALLETYTPSCRYGFGNSVDSRCPVDLAPLTVSGSVTSTAIPNASTSATRRIFTDSTRAEADTYFSLGRLVWTGGPNAGAISEIKDFVAGQFILWEALLFPIALGDTYDATPGCDKSTADHLVFNADMLDFGGFPMVPGGDSILASPDAKG